MMVNEIIIGRIMTSIVGRFLVVHPYFLFSKHFAHLAYLNTSRSLPPVLSAMRIVECLEVRPYKITLPNKYSNEVGKPKA